MIEKIEAFFKSIQENPIELYNEFGLQHELAIFLRINYPELKVRLEYPTPKIFNPLTKFLKKEIDIYITTEDEKKFVIELKMPKDNGGTPKSMYHAIEDVKFLEQLRLEGIDGCYSILATPCSTFWKAPRADSGIYQFFNGEQITIQSIDNSQLPTFLHNKGEIKLKSNYKTIWKDYVDLTKTNWKYYILSI